MEKLLGKISILDWIFFTLLSFLALSFLYEYDVLTGLFATSCVGMISYEVYNRYRMRQSKPKVLESKSKKQANKPKLTINDLADGSVYYIEFNVNSEYPNYRRKAVFRFKQLYYSDIKYHSAILENVDLNQKVPARTVLYDRKIGKPIKNSLRAATKEEVRELEKVELASTFQAPEINKQRLNIG